MKRRSLATLATLVALPAGVLSYAAISPAVSSAAVATHSAAVTRAHLDVASNSGQQRWCPVFVFNPDGTATLVGWRPC